MFFALFQMHEKPTLVVPGGRTDGTNVARMTLPFELAATRPFFEKPDRPARSSPSSLQMNVHDIDVVDVPVPEVDHFRAVSASSVLVEEFGSLATSLSNTYSDDQ